MTDANTVTNTVGTGYHNVATVSSGRSDPESVNHQAPAATPVSCLANPVVTSNADSGAGTLRQAITDACDGSTITFDMTQVVSPITLTSGELGIDKNLTIQGAGSQLLTLRRSDAAPDFRIFLIGLGQTVNLSGMTITNGRAPGGTAGGEGGNGGALQ